MRRPLPPLRRARYARPTAMDVSLVLTLALTLGLIVYGLYAWERIVARRRREDPGTA